MASEWVKLAKFTSLLNSSNEAAVIAAIKCRRVVEIRAMGGELWICARVPLPPIVEQLIAAQGVGHG